MNFRIQRRIATELDCVTRGGMCIPLYTPGGLPHRLSIDTDLMTEADPSEVEEAMGRVDESNPEFSVNKRKPPKRPYPMDNLLSYSISYTSASKREDVIKVDFLCSVDVKIPSTLFHDAKLFGSPIGYPISALTRGALIGDKLTTLALDKIGLRWKMFDDIPKQKYEDIPKQIHDVGSQLKFASRSEIGEAMEVFVSFTKFKVRKYRHDPPYTVNEIVDSIRSSLHKLFVIDSKRVYLTSEQEDILSHFKGRFLGRVIRYKERDHLTDILLLVFMTNLLKKYIRSPELKSELSQEAMEAINEIRDRVGTRRDEIRNRREQILANRPALLRRFGKAAYGLWPEHLLLLSRIHPGDQLPNPTET